MRTLSVQRDSGADRPDPPADVNGDRAATARSWGFRHLGLAVSLAIAALAVYPLGRVVIGVFVSDGRLTAEPLRAAFAVPDVWTLIRNTVVVVAASSAAAVLAGTVLAWLNERTDARMGAMTDSFPLIPFLLPPIAGAVGWVLLLSPDAGLLNAVIRGAFGWIGVDMGSGPLTIYSWYGMIFVYTLYQVPYVFMLVSAGLRNIDPYLDEQSRICGAGVLRTARRVTLPAVKQSLGGAVLLMTVQGLSLYSVPVIIGTGAGIDVLSVRIVDLMSFTFPAQIATAVGLSLILMVLVAVAWMFQARLLRRGQFSAVGGKGQRARPIELGRWRIPARLLMIGYGLLAVVMPVGGLLLISLNGLWTVNIDWGGLSFSTMVETVVDHRTTGLALRNSVGIAIVGATVGMAAAAIIAMYIRRYRSRVSTALDGAIKLPAVVSHLVIAVGFILAFAGPPFNLAGTLLILLLVYITMYLPQGSVSADAAISQVGQELPEASAVSGAGEGRTLVRVYLPLIMPGLMAGWAYLFARMIGDLTATAILAGTTNTVVGFRILQIFQNGSYPQLASLAIVLTVISTIVVVTVLAVVRRRARWISSVPTGTLNV